LGRYTKDKCNYKSSFDSLKSAFGLWKNRDINEKDLRKKAWKQNKLDQSYSNTMARGN